MIIVSLAFTLSARATATFPPHLVGTPSAAAALLERVLPGSSSHFDLAIVATCPGIRPGTACFTIADATTSGDKISISGTSASEITGGIGVYLREFCGMTIGWPRGGGNNIFTPATWPKISSTFTRARSVPYSHVTQVCTHSYTLVWYGWEEWERFIDWMALAGHNSIVAPTGQEEVQYKVLTSPQFNLSDMEVRNWTNGPAFLTWSRGQNSHGNGIAGPTPRSFMKGQHALQQQIITRYRELGIAGHQAAFGGYAPWALAQRQNDTGKGGATRGVCPRGHNAGRCDIDTAWIDGRDPLYTKVADAWMKQMIEDFGSDHVWQADAYLGNGTGWGGTPDDPSEEEEQAELELELELDFEVATTPCTWSAKIPNTYLAECATRTTPGLAAEAASSKCPSFVTVAEAQAACVSYQNCGGVTTRSTTGKVELRAGGTPIAVPASDGESSYVILNALECKWELPPDPVYLARAKAAYGAMARADGPEARWIFQGWAIHVKGSGMTPPSPKALSRVHGYSAAAPPGKFILFDMGRYGEGQWQTPWTGKWGIPFIWTSLHTFGGNMATHGNLSEINAIPFTAPPFVPVAPDADNRTQGIRVLTYYLLTSLLKNYLLP